MLVSLLMLRHLYFYGYFACNTHLILKSFILSLSKKSIIRPIKIKIIYRKLYRLRWLKTNDSSV